MKYLLSVLGLCLLAGCQTHEARPPLNTQELAERFIKPAGEQGIIGVVFNLQGDAIALTSNGKILEPCRLPSPEGEIAKGADSKLPICEGTTNTSIYNISQLTLIRHKGSDCFTATTTAGGTAKTITGVCWPPR